MLRVLHCLPLVLLAAGLLTGSAAQATILTFDIDNFPAGTPAPNNGSLITTHAAYGDNVSSTVQLNVGGFNYNYGMGNGFTPDVTVTYALGGANAVNMTYYTDGDAAVSPNWKDTNFLIGGAGGTTRSFLWTFTPSDPELGVRINSFDLFRYTGSEVQDVNWILYDSVQGGTVLASANTGPFNTTIAAPLTVSPNLLHFGTVVLEIQHLVGSGGGFSLDNLNFDQIQVPEPSTCLLLTLGLVGLAANRRRHRRQAVG